MGANRWEEFDRLVEAAQHEVLVCDQKMRRLNGEKNNVCVAPEEHLLWVAKREMGMDDGHE